VSPSQKALIVKMEKEGIAPTPMTLAIGDGANDVGMIQEAHLGIGISGKEGLQAVNSADFAIAQFRFLKSLLVVHGRWNYRRMAKVVRYSFYKNIVLTLTLFYFNYFSGFSGQSLYETNIYSLYNFALGLPPVAMGLFDTDLTRRFVSAHPEMYRTGRMNLDLNNYVMARWIFKAFWASLVIGVFLILAFSEQTDLEGLYVMGTLAYLVLVNCMLYKAMLEMSTINFWSSLSIFISLAGTLFFVWGYSFFAEYAPAFYNVGIVAFNHSMFWLVFITVPIITGVFDLLVAAVKTFYFPDPLRIAMEIDHLDRMERRREGLPEFGYGEGEDEDDEDDGSREEQQEGLPESAPTFGTTSSGDNVARALESEEWKSVDTVRHDGFAFSHIEIESDPEALDVSGDDASERASTHLPKHVPSDRTVA